VSPDKARIFTISFPLLADVEQHLRVAIEIMAAAEGDPIDRRQAVAARREVEEALEQLLKMRS